jgi:hypothetical protein
MNNHYTKEKISKLKEAQKGFNKKLELTKEKQIVKKD